MPEEIPNPMHLETKISAVFVTMGQPDHHQQASLDALNKHAEDICETLQPVFQRLIIEMLELKRQNFTQGD